MLIINDSLNKRFCEKVFGFSISFFKKCYVHNIFTILWTGITQIYSILLMYLLAPYPTPNPTHFPFLFLFLFSFFPSVFPQPRANPTPFVTPQLNSRVSKKKRKKERRYFKEQHVWPHLPHSPQPQISQESSLSWPATHLLLSPFFFFFFFISYHSLISFHGHSTTSTIIFR